MKIGNYFLGGFLIIGLMAYTFYSFNKVKGNGKLVKKEVQLDPFSELKISGVFDVYLNQGEKEKLIIETDENIADLVEVSNVNNLLSISIQKGANIEKPTKFNLYLTLQNLTKLDYQGVGDIKCKTPLNLKTFEITNTGVGDIDLNINASILSIENSGVGDVNLEGNGSHLIIKNSGVGDFKSKDFVAKDVKITNSGVGDVVVFSNEKIEINTSGVGDVIYYGSPAQKVIKNKGVSKIIRR
ncbi:MAG: head GIN domain-containing protein [Putridiphycobacter sp.]